MHSSALNHMGHHALPEAEQQRAYLRKNLYILHDLNFKNPHYLQ